MLHKSNLSGCWVSLLPTQSIATRSHALVPLELEARKRALEEAAVDQISPLILAGSGTGYLGFCSSLESTLNPNFPLFTLHWKMERGLIKSFDLINNLSYLAYKHLLD